MEYLLSPDEGLTPSLIEAQTLPTGLDVTNQSALLRAKLRLNVSTWHMILGQIEYAFEQGWHECKYLKGRRTEITKVQLVSEFMDKIKGLD